MTFKYENELSTPIPFPPYGQVNSEDGRREIAEAIVNLQHRKMSLLFDAHQIKRGDWQALCFALAETHVPGFRLATIKTGRPVKWDFHTRAKLFIAIERTGIKNITEATKILANEEPWKSMVTHARGADTLRDEYTRTDSGFVAMWRKVGAIAADYETQSMAARKEADTT